MCTIIEKYEKYKLNIALKLLICGRNANIFYSHDWDGVTQFVYQIAQRFCSVANFIVNGH